MKPISLILAVALAYLFTGCGGRNLVQGQMQVDETQNLTVYSLSFELSEPREITVSLTNVDSGELQYIQGTAAQALQQVLLPALKPGTTYSVELLSEHEVVSETYTFRTRPLNSALFANEKKRVDPNAFEGYILTQRKGTDDGYLYMLDAEGDIVWYQYTPGIPKLSQITESKQILALLGNPKHDNSAGDRIVGLELEGNVTLDIDLKKLNLVAHHEVLEREGDLYTLVYDTIPNEVNGTLERAVSSAVVRLNTAGEILWKWSTFNVVLPTGIPESEMSGDWGHANALAFDTDGNLLISYRDWNQIWKIDVATGSRMWILGEGGDFKIEGLPFDAQHAIIKDPQDNYLLFDNGRNKRRSRIVSYVLQKDLAREAWRIDLPEDLFSVKMGNAALLPNGNILACISGSESVVVLDASGNLLYQVTTGLPSPYRATYVPSFYTKSN
ncbi:MAG: hypothetical protein RLZZ241_2147 [Bacteroidota bacterium]|jgi:outer membrane protein assembly factor BamB